MQRHEILKMLEAQKLSLKEFNVKSLILFGSVARDAATPWSDVDLYSGIRSTYWFTGICAIETTPRNYFRMLGRSGNS